MSRDLILGMSVSLDGFVADPDGKIDWMFPTMSDGGRKWVAETLGQMGLIGMGRRSYEGMADFWPASPAPMAAAMNEIPKLVFSRSGQVSPPSMEKSLAALKDAPTTELEAAIESWRNPIVAGKDLVADIERLKAEGGKPINILGGASFGSALIATGLVDVIRLAVHPIAIGRGLTFFDGLQAHLRLKLEDFRQTETGAVGLTYRVSRA